MSISPSFGQPRTVVCGIIHTAGHAPFCPLSSFIRNSILPYFIAKRSFVITPPVRCVRGSASRSSFRLPQQWSCPPLTVTRSGRRDIFFIQSGFPLSMRVQSFSLSFVPLKSSVNFSSQRTALADAGAVFAGAATAAATQSMTIVVIGTAPQSSLSAISANGGTRSSTRSSVS